MSNFELAQFSEHTKHEQWIFPISLISGKYDRHKIQSLFINDPKFSQNISIEELEEILSACEKTTGNFLCTRFVLLLIISFAISALVLIIMAFYFTIFKKADKMTIIYTYVIAVAIGVFCNLLLFLIYMLIVNIYEKQLNLHLGQRRIVGTFEKRGLFWRANGSKLTLNNIYSKKCDSECRDYHLNKKNKEELKESLLH